MCHIFSSSTTQVGGGGGGVIQSVTAPKRGCNLRGHTCNVCHPCESLVAQMIGGGGGGNFTEATITGQPHKGVKYLETEAGGGWSGTHRHRRQL